MSAGEALHHNRLLTLIHHIFPYLQRCTDELLAEDRRRCLLPQPLHGEVTARVALQRNDERRQKLEAKCEIPPPEIETQDGDNVL